MSENCNTIRWKNSRGWQSVSHVSCSNALQEEHFYHTLKERTEILKWYIRYMNFSPTILVTEQRAELHCYHGENSSLFIKGTSIWNRTGLRNGKNKKLTPKRLIDFTSSVCIDNSHGNGTCCFLCTTVPH